MIIIILIIIISTQCESDAEGKVIIVIIIIRTHSENDASTKAKQLEELEDDVGQQKAGLAYHGGHGHGGDFDVIRMNAVFQDGSGDEDDAEPTHAIC